MIFFLTIILIVGCVFVFFGTSKYGLGLSPDSIIYLSVSQSLGQGNGFIKFDGSYYSNYPPLFPMILSILNFVNIDLMDGIKFFHALVYGLIIFFSGKILFNNLKLFPLLFLSPVFILFSIPIFYSSVMIWSELFFVFLTILFIFFFIKFQKNNKFSLLIVVSIIAALSVLQRYIGLTLILSGIILLLFHKNTNNKFKLRNILIFGIISCLPIAIWVLRNNLLTGTISGDTRTVCFLLNPFDQLLNAFHYISIWFLPANFKILRIVLFVFLLFFVGIEIKQAFFQKNKTTYSLVLLIFSFVYLFSLVILASLKSCEQLDDRLLTPLYFFIVYFLFSGFENIYKFLSKYYNKILCSFIVFVSISILLIHPIVIMGNRLQTFHKKGVEGYSSEIWQQSPIINFLIYQQENSTVLSNDPLAIYFFSNKKTTTIPDFIKKTSNEKSIYLVLFYDCPWDFTKEIEILKSKYHFKKIKNFDDSEIFFLNSKIFGDGINERNLP